MLKRSVKVLNNVETNGIPHGWPVNLIPPGQPVTQEYLEKKYSDFKFTESAPMYPKFWHRFGDWKWKAERAYEENARKVWAAELKNHSGLETSTFFKYAQYIDWAFVLIFSILILPMWYIALFWKTEWQKRHQWFVNSPLSKRGAPYTPNAWDKVKRGDDGHYYIGKERLD